MPQAPYNGLTVHSVASRAVAPPTVFGGGRGYSSRCGQRTMDRVLKNFQY
jgi:hypothetical protein